MINFFCALPCEAKPLIQHYKLSRHPGKQLYDTFIDKNNAISMTIMGTGKISAAASVMHAFMLLPGNKYDSWINIGIAGHPTHRKSTLILANKIIDKASERSWYPQILVKTDIIQETLITIDKPTSKYPQQGMIDMEASGFYEMTSKIGLMELSHSLKVISDNSQIHYTSINKKSVSELISKNLEALEAFTAQIAALTKALPTSDNMQATYHQLISSWHFTFNQRIQLKKILQRWSVLFPDKQPEMTVKTRLTTASDVISTLEASLDEANINFH